MSRISKTNGKICYLVLLFVVAVISLIACTARADENRDDIFLTSEELQWLEAHEDEITIGYTTDYPPVEFLDNGEYVGFSADYFKLLEEKLGIDIQMIQFDHWNNLIEHAQNKQIAGITAATKTEDRSEYLEFTVPYILNPNVIITRENFSEKLNFEKLANSSMRILIVEDYAIAEYLDINYPKLDYQTVESANEGLRMVSFGEADAMIIEIMSASSSIERDNISNLIVNSETSYESNLSIATRSDWPILSDILNKGLARISADEKQAIRMKWIPMERKSLFENQYFWVAIFIVILVLSIIIIAITFWNQSLQRAVEDKTQKLEKSKDELRYKSYHDELTGLYNRSYYNEQLEILNVESQLPLSILLADCNGLKITNDTLGHDEGDQLLIKISEIIKRHCRGRDIVARIGGDEFVIIMPQTSNTDAERICSDIKASCAQSKKDPIKPSVAIGCATKTSMTEALQSVFKKAEDHMYENKMYESEGTHTSILESLKTMLRETTSETADHSKRMEIMAVEMGKALQLDGKSLNALATLADLHDLGKVAVPEEILHKKGPLSESEWDRIRRHPDIGFKIASSSPKLRFIAEGILAHHEHWDGKGYPNGLQGEEIPLLSRIISVVDAYDVMTNNRPYKTAMEKRAAMAELDKCSGKQFDPQMVQLFLELFESEAISVNEN